MHSLIGGIALVMIVTAPCAGQSIHGTVTNRGNGKPLRGAIVRLVSETGLVAAEDLTDESGSFVLASAAAGGFRLRIEEIGFATEITEPFELAPDENLEYPVTVAPQALLLDGLTVHGKSRGCSIKENGETVARIWDEARKALGVLTLSQKAELVHFDTESFRRERNPVTHEIVNQERGSTFNRTGNPYRSVPVEDLEKQGYVRAFRDSTVYYAPDAQILLSDRFLDGHCFSIAERVEDRLIGLDFRPARHVSKPDIKGTLWVDRRTSYLRAVDFRYVGLRFDVPANPPGGRIEFERLLSNGAWIVRRWVIRMPVVAIRKSQRENPVTRAVEAHTEATVSAVVEEGGEVVKVATSRLYREVAGRGLVSGIVIDSLTGDHLRGAFVFLSGTSFSDSTDEAGRYRIRDVPNGQYLVSFAHPRIRALGIVPPVQRVEIVAKTAVTVDLGIPSLGTFARRYCPQDTSEENGILVGQVEDRRTREPVPHAHVQASWTADTRIRPESMPRTVTRSGTVTRSTESAWISTGRRERELVTDRAGSFRVCGIPRGALLRIEVNVGRSSIRRSVQMENERLVTKEITIDLQ